MSKAHSLWAQFERRSQSERKVDYAANLHLVEALYEEACALGVFPLANPLDGIEVDLRLAKALNVYPPA
jgi:hypothetical protein